MPTRSATVAAGARPAPNTVVAAGIMTTLISSTIAVALGPTSALTTRSRDLARPDTEPKNALERMGDELKPPAVESATPPTRTDAEGGGLATLGALNLTTGPRLGVRALNDGDVATTTTTDGAEETVGANVSILLTT